MGKKLLGVITNMIYIITPCSRPENLEEISKTIPPECKWVVVHDNTKPVPLLDNATFLVCDDTGPFGTKARNHALDFLPLKDDDFILYHDDDNIIHPKWYSTIYKYLDYNFSILTWGQLNKNNIIRLSPTESPQVENIDSASFLVSWKYNKDIRHELVYVHDGLYAEACGKNGPVLCINDFLCYYNYLRTS